MKMEGVISYQLDVFDELIKNIPSFPNVFSEIDYVCRLKELQEETRNTKVSIKDCIGALEPGHVGSFLQNHRDAVLALLDVLIEYLGLENAYSVYCISDEPTLTNYCKHIYIQLSHLSTFLNFKDFVIYEL